MAAVHFAKFTENQLRHRPRFVCIYYIANAVKQAMIIPASNSFPLFQQSFLKCLIIAATLLVYLLVIKQIQKEIRKENRDCVKNNIILIYIPRERDLIAVINLEFLGDVQVRNSFPLNFSIKFCLIKYLMHRPIIDSNWM